MKLRSPIFGTFAVIYAESGVQVQKGEALCEVEAMKVNYRVEAPCDGVVTWSGDLGEVFGEGDEIGEVS